MLGQRKLPSTEDTLVPMAECFIEEFMRMGYSQAQIAGLFQNPMYAGLLMVTRARGTAFVRQLIADTFTKWGRCSCASVKRSDREQANDAALETSASTPRQE
jgi:hypothetical protein